MSFHQIGRYIVVMADEEFNVYDPITGSSVTLDVDDVADITSFSQKELVEYLRGLFPQKRYRQEDNICKRHRK